jgi:glycerol kinase
MQFQADVLGVPVIVPEVSETTALGAAYLAGIATGLWDREGVRDMWRERATYEPRMAESEREQLLGRWHRALERARAWARTGESA